jgi:glycosyltransferase involved in cell wall biosynthesis
MPPADLRAPAASTPPLGIPTGPAGTGAARQARPAILVLSEQRWSLVYHRPQHLLTRLARDFDVFYVEEPVHDDATAGHLVASCPAAGIEVLVPHVPHLDAGFDGESLVVLGRLLATFARERQMPPPIAWLTTPMAAPLLGGLAPRAVVYDRADDHLDGQADAPPAAPVHAVREAMLMARADLVLSASPTLHALNKRRHGNAHCLPDAVDAEHFDPARLWERSVEAADAAGLHDGMPHPRLGWFGAIDERVDLDLLAALAARRPDWQLVMAGPVLLPDPDALPQRPNLHWLGRQSYALLPYLLDEWDLCLLPLAHGPRTRFQSLSRPLEYLAGGKPVVATALPDVLARLGDVVRTADGVDAFVAACSAALSEGGPARERRRLDGHAAVARCGWDRGAARLRVLLMEFLSSDGR